MVRYGNSVHTGYQHFTAKNYVSANCNYIKGNDDTSDLDILNDESYFNWPSKHHLIKKQV